MTLVIASGLIERGHAVDLLLERFLCHYPFDVPSGARILPLSSRTDGRTRANLERIPAACRPLAPEPRSWRVRYPRIALASKLRRTQRGLLLSTRLPRWAAGIAAYLDRERPDALLAVNTLSAAAAAMALQLAEHPVRLVSALHNALRSRRTLYRARGSYPFADVVVGVSRGVTSEFGRLPGLSRGRAHTVYNPVVSTRLTHRAREPVEHPWLGGSPAPLILAVGKLIERKDFATLLAAFARLVRSRPARLIVLGEGRLRPKLLRLARELRIHGNVDFPGFMENPYSFLAKADLFVLSSRGEGLPTVLIEALACGCPVVSTDCDFGPREILEGGKYGELAPVGDPEALSAAMVRALDAPPPREALRERAFFFAAERTVEQYEKLLLDGPGAATA